MSIARERAPLWVARRGLSAEYNVPLRLSPQYELVAISLADRF